MPCEKVKLLDKMQSMSPSLKRICMTMYICINKGEKTTEHKPTCTWEFHRSQGDTGELKEQRGATY